MNYRMLLARTVFCGMGMVGYAYGGVINGGFETGNYTGWTLSGNPADFMNITNPSLGCAGAAYGNCATRDPSTTYAAFFGNSLLGGVEQSLQTVSGFTYEVDFWLSVDVDKRLPVLNEYRVSWDGSLIVDVFNGGSIGWQYVRLPGLIASTSTTVLKFGFVNSSDAFGLDDVNISAGTAPVAGSAAPEPVSMILTGTSLIALAGLSRLMRRKRR